MSTSHQHQHHVRTLLEAQLQGAQRMLAVLNQEYAALQGNDLHIFEQAMDVKQQQVRQLEQLERRTLSELERYIGAPCGKEQLAGYIEQSRNQPLTETWQALRNVLQQCHDQNLVNNRVLQASRAQVQQTLDILRGTTNGDQTYHASGKPGSGTTQGQSIAIA